MEATPQVFILAIAHVLMRTFSLGLSKDTKLCLFISERLTVALVTNRSAFCGEMSNVVLCFRRETNVFQLH